MMSLCVRYRCRAALGGGFTLVEVLVVVAIIALLASILIPALVRSRDHARRAVCLSNLRQLGFGMAAYSENAKGLLPYRGYKSYTIGEYQWEALGLTPKNKKVVCNLGVLHGKYAGKDWDLFYCPSLYGRTRDMRAHYEGETYGGLCTLWDEGIRWTFGGYNYAVPLKPRGTCPKADGKYTYPEYKVSDEWKEYVASRTGGQKLLLGVQALVSDWGVGGMRFVHGTGLNVLFTDYHARFVQTKDLRATSGSPQSYQMWYYLSTHH